MSNLMRKYKFFTGLHSLKWIPFFGTHATVGSIQYVPVHITTYIHVCICCSQFKMKMGFVQTVLWFWDVS